MCRVMYKPYNLFRSIMSIWSLLSTINVAICAKALLEGGIAVSQAGTAVELISIVICCKYTCNRCGVVVFSYILNIMYKHIVINKQYYTYN